MRITAHSLAVDTETPLDARIYRRAVEDDGAATHPIVHLCTTAMPEDRGDYGSGAVDELTGQDVFISLVEFDAADAGKGLFSTQGRPPTIDPSAFSSQALQRVQNNQSGAQFWFTEEGRPFCLYVVLGSHANRVALARKATELVQSLQIATPGGVPKPLPKLGRALHHSSQATGEETP